MKKWISIIIAVIVLVVVAFGANIYIQNVTYKSYLSDRLANMVTPMTSSIINAERTIIGVIEKQTIDKNGANSLRSYFSQISNQSKNMSDLGVSINKLQRNKIENAIITNAKLSDYFKNIGDSLEAGQGIGLNPKELTEMREIQALVSKYSKISRYNIKGVTTSGISGEFWHYYYKTGISQKYWINFITEIETNTPRYDSLLFLN